VRHNIEAERRDEISGILEGCCVTGALMGCETTCAHETVRRDPVWVEHSGDLPDRGPTSARVRRDLDELAGTPVVEGNVVRILSDGADSFGAMLNLVRTAKSDIRFENFIFRADTVGRTFARELRSRAADGLRVRVLHDPAGAVMARRLPADLLFRGSDAEVRLFNLGVPTRARRSIGRDHRKLVVVDRAEMVAGGICLADAWAGNCIRHCTWRDSAIHVKGPAALNAAETFDGAWKHGRRLGWDSKRRSPNEKPTASPHGADGGVSVRLLASMGHHRPTLNVLERVIASAEQHVLVANPYLVPPPRLVRALLDAAGRGVEVTILIPGRNNHRLVGLSAEHGLGALLEAGCQVFLWQGAMLHAKTMVVDGAWMLVGSTNLDSLSLRKNAELDVEVHGSNPAEAMTDLFRADCAVSTPLTLAEWRARPRARRLGAWLAHRLRHWQ